MSEEDGTKDLPADESQEGNQRQVEWREPRSPFPGVEKGRRFSDLFMAAGPLPRSAQGNPAERSDAPGGIFLHQPKCSAPPEVLTCRRSTAVTAVTIKLMLLMSVTRQAAEVVSERA